LTECAIDFLPSIIQEICISSSSSSSPSCSLYQNTMVIYYLYYAVPCLCFMISISECCHSMRVLTVTVELYATRVVP